jgi:hypothetical protein
MEIKVVDGKLSLTSLFAPVAVGYGVGAGVIFLPMFLLIGLVGSFTPVVDQSGQTVSGAAFFLPMVIMVPLILLMQSVMFAGLIMLGLAIYRRFGKINVISVRETPE